MTASDSPAVSISGLTFTHVVPGSKDDPFVALRDISFTLPRGSRTLMIGGNGAGKSTLLYLLAGKRMIQKGDVRVLDRDVFRDSPQGVVYLGTEWAINAGARGDIVVSDFLDSVGGYRHKERRDHLLNILDINLDWHMHAISDGERRRVQLCMGLMGNWDLLLLDEVTVDLDVFVRDQLLTFLEEETITRNATVIYATHIFDGLNQFPTHVAHMCDGQFKLNPTPWPLANLEEELSKPGAKETFVKSGSPLHALALTWLSNDRYARLEAEKKGERRKVRGSRLTTVPSDSETFYRKYDYSH